MLRCVMAVKDKKKSKVTMGSTSATSQLIPNNEKETESSIIADSSGLLQTLQGHVEEVRALLQCGICVRPLYEPYTLACGHTFCYGCLTSWFSSGRSHKTCPDCRAQVKIQPAPAYLVRAIVQMFTSNAELLEKGETTAEHSKNKREEAEKLEADKASDNPKTGGLFQGCFKPKPQHLGPIFDADDGVTRCPNCAWELEEDECLNCGYHIDDGSIGDSAEFSDMTDEDDEDDDNEDDEDEEMDDDMTDYGAWPEDYPHAFPVHDPQQQFFDGVRDLIHHHFRHHRHHHHHHHYPLHNHQIMRPVYLGNEQFDVRDDTDASSMAHERLNESEEDEEEDDSSEESSNSSEDDDDDDGEMDSFIDDGSVQYEDSLDGQGGHDTDHSTVVGDQSEIRRGTYTASPISEASDATPGRQWEDSESYNSESPNGTPDPHSEIRRGTYSDSANSVSWDESSIPDFENRQGSYPDSFNSDHDPDEEEDDEDEPIRPAPIRRPGQNAFYRRNPISRGSSRAASNTTSGVQNRPDNGVANRRIGLSRSHNSGPPLPQVSRQTGGPSNSSGGFRNPRHIPISNGRGAGTSATNAITVDDDSEDEMPVPANRRSRINRR